MPPVARRKGALTEFVDESGTPKSHEVYPTQGDLKFTESLNVTEYLHRDTAMADGEGVFADAGPLQEATFSYYVHDLTDAVKTDAFIRWMRGNLDSTADAITSASWTETTTRTDGLKTLHVRHWPQGKGTGKPYWQFDDAIVTSYDSGDGDPAIATVTIKSTTNQRATRGYGA